MKLRGKFFIVIFLGFLVLLLLLSGIFYISEKKSLRHQVDSRLRAIVSLQRDRLNSIIEQNLERLRLVSSRTQMRISLDKYLADVEGEEALTHLRKVERIVADALASIASFRQICILSPSGTVVAEAGASAMERECACGDDLLQRSLKHNSADTVHLDREGKPRLLLAGPLHLDN
ncbi:MAG: hypothetical protein JXR89_01190, partial [Deltaproteobacteria bacterium]|nr:hypothetical protein [Deltaproteobacteria bacterium]